MSPEDKQVPRLRFAPLGMVLAALALSFAMLLPLVVGKIAGGRE